MDATEYLIERRLLLADIQRLRNDAAAHGRNAEVSREKERMANKAADEKATALAALDRAQSGGTA